jgi:hypothetical protein
MVDKWLLEIKSIVKKGEEKISGVRREREQRLAKRMKICSTIRKKIINYLRDVQPVIAQYYRKKECEKEDKQLPAINVGNDGFEIILEMPKLSDVNLLDLRFQIEIDVDCTYAKILAYRVSKEKTDLIGSATDNYDFFIKDVIKRFLQAWYSRKLSDELDKEREYRIAITARGLK